jgi:hypothetical protein
VRVAWVELDASDAAIGRTEQAPMRLHCAFRTETEHLLARAGFEVEALYGDFERRALADDSPEMVWIARRR